MIDSHCHLDFDVFDSQRIEILHQSAAAGVSRILIPGTQSHRWQKIVDLCEQHAQLSFALGLHPYFLNTFSEADLQRLSDQVKKYRSRMLAIGEIGLDFYIEQDKSLQQYVFEAQLDIAIDQQLPVIIHHRKSHNQLIRTLKSKPLKRGGVIHAFSGSLSEATQYLEMGFLLGVGGTITYSRAVKTRNAISQLPLEGILLETDAPDMPMEGRQGQINRPDYLPRVLDELASMRVESAEDIELQTDANFKRLFFPE